MSYIVSGFVTHNHYDHVCREVMMRPDANLYELFHELAHKEQHEENGWLWKSWYYGRWIPIVTYFVRLNIEKDAARRAEKAMREAGVWKLEYEEQAKRGVKSYRWLREEKCCAGS